MWKGDSGLLGHLGLLIDTDARALAAAIAAAGPNPKAVIEATYGWYRAADVLEECGAELHLAHPLGMKGSPRTAG